MIRKSVYILWHIHRIDKNNEDKKLIGVYSSLLKAKTAQRITGKLPGFRRQKKGFTISKYEINKNHWTEGFITVR